MHPRADERALLAGHMPREVEDAALGEVRRRYQSWDITRDNTGMLVARHRHEQPNARLARAGVVTEIRRADLDELERQLFVQRALRGDGAG